MTCTPAAPVRMRRCWQISLRLDCALAGWLRGRRVVSEGGRLLRDLPLARYYTAVSLVCACLVQYCACPPCLPCVFCAGVSDAMHHTSR